MELWSLGGEANTTNLQVFIQSIQCIMPSSSRIVITLKSFSVRLMPWHRDDADVRSYAAVRTSVRPKFLGSLPTTYFPLIENLPQLNRKAKTYVGQVRAVMLRICLCICQAASMLSKHWYCSMALKPLPPWYLLWTSLIHCWTSSGVSCNQYQDPRLASSS